MLKLYLRKFILQINYFFVKKYLYPLQKNSNLQKIIHSVNKKLIL